MKPIIFILLSLFAGSSAFSQIPTLTMLNTGPIPGDIFTSINADTTGVGFGTDGANQIWDYSNLIIGTDEVVENYYKPDTIKVPNSTVVCWDESFVWYMKVDQSQYSFLTPVTNTSGMPPYMQVPILIYSDPLKILDYPFTFSDNFIDSVAGAEYWGSSGIVYRFGSSSSTADGYGTLRLPSGTYHNVLRIKNIQDLRDSVIFNNPPILLSHNELYIWYDGIHKTPLLKIQYSTYTKNDTTHYYKSVLMGERINGVNEGNEYQLAFDLYPDPAVDQINLELYFPSTTVVNIAFLSITGNVVKAINNVKFGPGEHHKSVDVSTLPRGLYIIKCESTYGTAFKKMVLN